MKQRNAVTSLILAFFVPFYTYYWWHSTGKAMRQAGVNGVPSLVPLVLAIIVYMAALVTTVTVTIVTISHNVAAGGNGSTTAPPLYFLLTYLLIPFLWGVTAWYGYRFSKAAETITPLDLSAKLMAVVFVLIAPLGIFLIQDKFNKHDQLTPPQTPTTTQL